MKAAACPVSLSALNIRAPCPLSWMDRQTERGHSQDWVHLILACRVPKGQVFTIYPQPFTQSHLAFPWTPEPHAYCNSSCKARARVVPYTVKYCMLFLSLQHSTKSLNHSLSVCGLLLLFTQRREPPYKTYA